MSKLNLDTPGFLSEKLSNAQLPADPGLWQGIASQLPAAAGAAAAASSTGVATVAAKTALWIAAAAVVAATSYFAYVASTSEPVISQPTTPIQQTVTQNELSEGINVPSESSEPIVSLESDSIEPPAQAPANQRAEAPSSPTQPEPTPVNTPSKALADSKTNTPSAATAPPATPRGTSSQPPINPLPSTQPLVQEPEAAEPFSIDFSVEFDAYDDLSARFTSVVDGATHITWDFGDGAASDGSDVFHTFTNESTYRVTMTAWDEHGEAHAITADVAVKRSPKLVLPNIFTPNGDGLNDTLTIAAESVNVEVVRLMVIDARGKIVFEHLGHGPGWDGTLASGEPAPEGNYRLVVTASGTDGSRMNESTIVHLTR